MNTQSKSLVVYAILFSLLLSGCGTGQVFGPTITPIPTITYTPTLTPTATATFTPTSTFTPTATTTPTVTPTPSSTPTPEVTVVICTSENFLDHEIPFDPLFNGEYYIMLEKSFTTNFDPSKIKDVPLWGNGESIIYRVKTAPNFDPKAKDTWSFQRYLTGYTEYQGSVYAVMPIKFWNPKGKDSIVIALYKFDEYEKTDEAKKEAIRVWESKMNVTPLAYGKKYRTDPVMIKTMSMYPDWMDRIKRFVNNNKYNTKNQDISALDGMVFPAIIRPSDPKYHMYE